MTARSRPLVAAAWIMGAIASFSAMAVAGRELSAELDTFEIMAWRSGIGLPVVGALLLARLGLAGLRVARPGLHALRHSVHFAAQNLWFYGVAAIPLAQLVSLEFTNPIWVALLAPLMLGEALTRAKLMAAGLGFAGVLVIAQPGVAPLEWGHAAALGSALGFALTNIMTRRLSETDATLTILFWMTASQFAMALLCGAPGGLAAPSAALIPYALLAGATGLSAHFCLTSALAAAPASVVAPMEFLRLPVIAALGAALYGEPVTIALAAGAALILSGNAVNLRAARAARALP